jgi:molecular chaperone GrpE (heat shock protein)
VESKPPRAGVADDADAELESAVDSMRRLFCEFIERRTDSLLAEVGSIREAVASPRGMDPAVVLDRFDALLDRFGAVRFTAERLDFIDPAIHEVAAERNLVDLPDGVIVETLRPGLRSSSGAVVWKARVAINRKGS